MSGLLKRITETLIISIYDRVSCILHGMSQSNHDNNAAKHASSSSSVSDLVVRRALDIFRNDPAKRWTVDALARSLGVSRPSLGRRFAEALGLSPLRALRAVRMEKAALLLQTTDSGLAQIALEVGYDSEFAFSRAFTRERGIRPGSFRKSACPGGGNPVLLAA